MAIDRTWLNALVNDSGGNTDGSIINKALFTAIADAIDGAVSSEVGTWTPVDGSGASLSFTTTTSQYIVLFNELVVAAGDVTYPVTANGSGAQIAGMPYASESVVCWGAFIAYTDEATLQQALVPSSSASVTLRSDTGAQITNAAMSGNRVIFVAIYRK